MTRYSKLCHFSPMPPTRNGIADYAYEIIAELSRRYGSTVACEDAFAEVPEGVALVDPMQAFRFITDETLPVYQVGNNADHRFVVQAMRHHPGLVVLHDVNLLYLHQFLGLSEEQMLRQLIRSNPFVAPVRASQVARRKMTQRTDYALFPMIEGIVSLARAVVVHSHFARTVILRHLGPALADKVHVIPHFAFDPPAETRSAARTRLGLEPDWFVLLTCGFATKVKRYDWVVDALDRLATARRNIVWVQAGPYRGDDFDLEALVARHPRVKAIARLTGYVSEQDLDGYLAAADVVVNLRFPSVGESSGILARALPAGACCVVSDTAAYREYPSDAVVKVPAMGAGRSLAATLAALADDPRARERFGSNAKKYASAELSTKRYAERFAAVLRSCETAASLPEAALPEQPVRLRGGPGSIGPAALLGKAPGLAVDLSIGPMGEELLGFDSLHAILGDDVYVNRAELAMVEGGSSGDDPGVFIEVSGRI